MFKIQVSKRNVRKKLRRIQKNAIEKGLQLALLEEYGYVCTFNQSNGIKTCVIIILAVIFILIEIQDNFNVVWDETCMLNTHFLVWEAARPVADCAYCENVSKPIILRNVTRDDFAKYAYSPKPIIVKAAISHWRAVKVFNFDFFKRLYESIPDSYNLQHGCQFINFKTDLFSLEEVFNMSKARARNEPGQDPWYVGWSHCHPKIKETVRHYYNYPEFLPEDAEFPSTEFIFFGYEIGAVLHLDYIARLMWQGQVQGSKIWTLAPVTECDHVCNGFEFQADPGDVVLLDTRIWYHATRIPKGQFSLTVSSEYG